MDAAKAVRALLVALLIIAPGALAQTFTGPGAHILPSNQYWAKNGFPQVKFGDPYSACRNFTGYGDTSEIEVSTPESYTCWAVYSSGTRVQDGFVYIITCPEGQEFVANPDYPQADRGDCAVPPVQCEEGDLDLDCRIDCPATSYHTGGYVGFGGTCPTDYAGTIDGEEFHDYACITDGDIHMCDPEGSQNALPDYSGPQAVDGDGTTNEEGDEFGSTEEDEGITHGNEPGTNSTCLNDLLVTGAASDGCIITGPESEVPPYIEWSELDHNCDGAGFACEPEDFNNSNLTEACRMNPGMPQCQIFDTTPVADLCAHGGVADPVIGCDYNPPTNSCDQQGLPFDSFGNCVTPPIEQVLTPNQPPPFTGGEPTPTTSTPTTTTTTTEQTTTVNPVTGETTITNTTTITTTGEGEGEGETGAGECDPTAANYAECIGIPGTGETTYSDQSGETMQQSAEGYYDSLSTVPIIAATSGIANIFSGTGTCPTPSFSAFGDTFTIDLHCTIYSNIAGIFSAVMLVFWSIVGVRNVMSA